MINTILVESKPSTITNLKSLLQKHCPYVQLQTCVPSSKGLDQLMADLKPDLLIADAHTLFTNSTQQLSSISCESILISEVESYAVQAFKYRAVDFILKPIYEDEMIKAIQNVQVLLKEKEQRKKDKQIIAQLQRSSIQSEIIGIPTMDGFEYLPVEEIVRCEGLQKCTRVITRDRHDIVSSYSIGEFYRLLQHYGFFFTHKSHLINLSKIRSYKKEGTLIMQDLSAVPIAKRRKHEFLKQVKHLGRTTFTQ